MKICDIVIHEIVCYNVFVDIYNYLGGLRVMTGYCPAPTAEGLAKLKAQKEKRKCSKFVRLCDDSALMNVDGNAKKLGLLIARMLRFEDQWNIEIKEYGFMSNVFKEATERGDINWHRRTFDRAVAKLKSFGILFMTDNHRWVFNPDGVVHEAIQFVVNTAKKYYQSPKTIKSDETTLSTMMQSESVPDNTSITVNTGIELQPCDGTKPEVGITTKPIQDCTTVIVEKETIITELVDGMVEPSTSSANYQVITDSIIDDVVELTFEAIPTEEVESLELMDVVNLHPMIVLETVKQVYGVNNADPICKKNKNGLWLVTYVWFYQTFGYRLTFEEVLMLTKELAEDWFNSENTKDFVANFPITAQLLKEHTYWETLQYELQHSCYNARNIEELKTLSSEQYVLEHGYHPDSKLNNYYFNQRLTDVMGDFNVGRVFLEKFNMW